MHIEFLVEEPSTEAALRVIVPRILGDAVTFHVHVHQGKPDLLKSLPGRLRGYARWLPVDWRIVVLADEDRNDCLTLKNQMEAAAEQAALVTKTRTNPPETFQVLSRIAIEELEAWFLGDLDALRMAYPRVSRNLATRAGFRNPDAITGGTWEALERVLQRAGYHKGGLAKIAAAREIAQHMAPERNRSRSFQVFRQGLLAAAGRAEHANA